MSAAREVGRTFVLLLATEAGNTAGGSRGGDSWYGWVAREVPGRDWES